MKILIALATYNRPIITELCLQNLQLVRDDETKIVIYDDCSDAYSPDYLNQYADYVTRFEKRGGIERSRAKAFRDFLFAYKNYDLLYLTDNDAIHDPQFTCILREIFSKQNQSNSAIYPVGLFNSIFHQTRIISKQDETTLYQTCPGISMCFTREMVVKIVDYLDKNPSAESTYGWDMEWPKVIGAPFLLPKVSYVEHFARDRLEGGMHSERSEGNYSALMDFERDRALNPSEYLVRIRPAVIQKILGYSDLEQEFSTLLKDAVFHLQSSEPKEAVTLLEMAILLAPEDPQVLRLLSVAKAMSFQYEEALQYINQSLALDASNGIAHSNKGNILKELGRYEEACISIDVAISLLPNYAEAYSNKGNILQELHRYHEAIDLYNKAIEIQPHYPEAYSNKGNALALLDSCEEAMRSYDMATTLNPQYIDAYWYKALLQLSTGDFRNGWENYEARWFKSRGIKFQYGQIPRIEDIERIAGKNILIWAEQGLGDSIQFCRYIELLANKQAHITFLIPSPLLSLMSSLSSFCIVTDKIQVDQKFDYQSPLLSLPLLFGTSLESIPKTVPYLTGNNERKDLIHQFQTNKGNLKVGLIWNGGFRADSPELWAINKRRNIELDQLTKLRDIEGVDFYSLQKGDPAESELRSRQTEVWPKIINCADLIHDFSDTATIMKNLDLIISVDTSSAHLAGALGRPMWLLNRYDSCWRWLRNSSKSPWYPTAKIYQQIQPGDWDEVIDRVKNDLIALVNQPKA